MARKTKEEIAMEEEVALAKEQAEKAQADLIASVKDGTFKNGFVQPTFDEAEESTDADVKGDECDAESTDNPPKRIDYPEKPQPPTIEKQEGEGVAPKTKPSSRKPIN